MGISMLWGFPYGTVVKNLPAIAGKTENVGSIPWSGRSPGEGIGYPLWYSWAFLVAQMVNNPLSMQETCVQSLSWEDPLEKSLATHSSILARRIPLTEPGSYSL